MSMRFPSGRDAGLGPAGAGLSRALCLGAALLLPALLAGCGDIAGDFGERANKPLSNDLQAQMEQMGMAPNSPILIRAYKKEAEVEVWKMRTDGHYALFKSYPICRWSGQLGPKTREGDRQVPEGFYTITPAQMNPRSEYYLSFNVGYPNAYDQAHGYSGGEIMVHGICSSAGCFSMTDQQIAEIYALAREAFAGGEPVIQFQAYPFHMTAENFAKYRLDPHIAFWKELKVGADNFEVTKQEVAVGVCNSHYVFNAVPADGASFDPTGPCPPLQRDETVALAVNAKQAADEAKVAELVASGVKPVRTIYADGGQNAQFTARWDYEHWQDVSRPEALQQAGVDVPVTKVKLPSLAKLEAEKRKAEAAAALAEKKAEAAHAFAYADQPVAPPPAPKPQQTGFSIPSLIPGQQSQEQPQPMGPQPQPAPQQQQAFSIPSLIPGPQTQQQPQQFGPQPPQPAPQQPAGFDMAGLGHFFAPQTQQPAPPPAPDTTGTSQQFQQANAPAPQPASTSPRNPQLATSTLHEPVPSKFSTTRMAAKPTSPPQPETQAEANADAAKAAYAQGMTQTGDDNKPLVPNPLQNGFSAFAGGDH
jgi:murein L,D-transpeptidase YafK